MRTRIPTPAAAVTLRGIPAVSYVMHRVEVTAGGESATGPSVWIAVDRQTDDDEPDRIGVELLASTFTQIGTGPNKSVQFLTDPETLRTLAAALLGAIDAAERFGVVAPAGQS